MLPPRKGNPAKPGAILVTPGVSMPENSLLEAVQNPSFGTTVGEWLSSPAWDQWGTFTFSKPLTHRSARRQFTRWVKKIPTCIPPTCVTWSSEDGERFGRTHVHSLLSWKDEEPPDASLVWRGWYSSYGRAEVVPYEAEKGAGHYVAKYVAKEVETDWDVIRTGSQTPSERLPF